MDKGQENSTGETVEKKPVRPVLIVSERTLYEYSMFLKHLLAGLTAESVPTALVCHPRCDVDSVVSPLVEVVRHPVFDLPFLGRQNRRVLVERLEKFQPTVLHCLCESKAKLARQLSHQMDLPYVLTVHSLQKRWKPLSVSLSHCARIIVPTNSIAASLTAAHPNLSGRLEQINVGTFAGETSRCFREPGGLVSMVTAHPLNRVDDFESLFRAVKHLVIDGYEFLLVVMGGGRAETRLRKLLRGLGLRWIVTIVPRLEPWRSVLAAGDVFLRPQPRAVFDPLLLEAMSVGSVVAGCQGGVDDLIIQDKTAVVFDPHDELSIYSTLQRLLDRPEFARQLAQGAQEYLRENYSVSKMVADILQTYRDAEQWYERRG
jgi:glycosyltransferase involved in cell wall biosynthesis